ncbi:alpha/beta fold hydrolase [Ahrensia sp. R2A130]|uniref:alpha/beta fold hydrolase n=1 Tax=Ahrensia sp. R2A130 TaxID=744979 RepID=UPI0001E0D0C8|nr:alpha/beta hydrolase [Ahrensia sp. R2A130]EFL90873.1 lysophospholipase L2 [Ahrensia sp. R2A130]
MDWTAKQTKLDTGTTAAIYRAAPSAAPKAIVHINHGMAEHAGRYGRFANALTKAGYAVIAHDHRGHGGTQHPQSSLGHFGPDGLDGVLADVTAVQKLAREQHPETQLITFGHSMGSIITLNHALRNPTASDAIACWNSGAEGGALLAVFRSILKFQKAFKGSDVPSGLAKTLTFDTWNKAFPPNRTDFDWLSRDDAEVDAYVADPLCGFPVTMGLWLSVTDGVKAGADDAQLAKLPATLPVHLVGGLKDPCTENGKAMQNLADRMTARGMSDVTLNLLPDTRHESLNEINRDETTADFIAWLDQRFGSR